jgi:signal transduction histidine kinase
MRSLRLRLLLGAVLGVSIALAVAGAVLVTIFDRHVHRRYVKELDDHLLQLAAAIQLDQAGTPALKHDLSDPAFRRPLSGLYWQVSEGTRNVLRSRSLWDSDVVLAGAAPSPGELAVREVSGPAGQRLVLVERLVLLQQRPLQLTVAGDRHEIDEARGDFARVVALSLAILAALLAAASWLQVGAGLAPLQVLRQQLSRLRQGQTQRLEGAYPDELSGLVEDLNGLIATQAREVERARANAGKLGHGLKTPLAILAAEARALRDQGNVARAEAIEHEIETMNAQVARNLAAARAVGPRKAIGASTPLDPLLQRLVGVMQRLPRGEEIEWSVPAMPAGVAAPIDLRDLEDLLGNLLDNARKWARSRVRVTVGKSAESVEVTIEDDGPGVPADRVDDALRGVRCDRAVPGTGIGLAIARDLAELNGGYLELDRSPLGGVRTKVRLACEMMPAAS